MTHDECRRMAANGYRVTAFEAEGTQIVKVVYEWFMSAREDLPQPAKSKKAAKKASEA